MKARHLAGGPLSGAIDIPRGVTAIVGGGGKTSLLMRLSRELAARGARVIVTTTTHIWPPEDMPVLTAPSETEIVRALQTASPVAVGTPAADGKLSPCGVSMERLSAVADYVLVEADGAKRLPLKAPAAHEPVIPENARLVLAVAGLDGVGKPLAETVFRPELYAALLEKSSLTESVAPGDVGQVLTHPDGQRKGVPPDARFAVVLNKADDGPGREVAEQIAAGIPRELAEAVYSTCLKEWKEPC